MPKYLKNFESHDFSDNSIGLVHWEVMSISICPGLHNLVPHTNGFFHQCNYLSYTEVITLIDWLATRINKFTTGTHCTLLEIIENKGTFLIHDMLHWRLIRIVYLD